MLLFVPLVILLVFFLMMLRPPRSTLFPTRRSSDLVESLRPGGVDLRNDFRHVSPAWFAADFQMPDFHGDAGFAADAQRSEEHTSELQSHSDLVCRLLLEKKK